MTKRMIFHTPFTLGVFRSNYASGIRPQKMKKAFEEIGYKVYEVTGGVASRKKSIKEIKGLIKNGIKFDFLYSESSAKAIVFTGKHRYPFNPFFDYSFFRYCRNRGIKTSLFYRDVFWRFAEFREMHGSIKTLFLSFFHLWDLLNYRYSSDIVYIPSTGYSRYIPLVKPEQFKLLPPGTDINDYPQQSAEDVLLYVGGLGGNHYKITAAFDGVIEDPESRLIVCTRESEWNAVKKEYPEHTRVTIVHKSGEALSELYSQAKYALLLMETTPYRKFAVPLKLYEYLGNGKPIIASKGTFAARLIEELGIGWTINYNAAELRALLIQLRAHPEKYLEVLYKLESIRGEHTWSKRAQQVQNDLL